MSNIRSLFATRIVKCRFCEYYEEDPDRLTSIGEGKIKDEYFDLVYYEETNTIEEAAVEAEYAYVECPNLRCSRLLVAEEERGLELDQLLVRTEETDDERLLRFPLEESFNIRENVEYGTVICSSCGYFSPDDLDERKFYIVYNPSVYFVRQPCIAIECAKYNCSHIKLLLKRGSVYPGLVQLKDSKIIDYLGIKPLSPEKLHVYDGKKSLLEFFEKLAEVLKQPDQMRLNELSNKLSRLTGRRVHVVLKKS